MKSSAPSLALGAALAAATLAAAAQVVPGPPTVKFIERSKAWGSAMYDYNNDGHADIFITGHDSNDRIWYWTQKGYVAGPQVFEQVDRHDCDAADVNHDGRLDLYCDIGGEKGAGIKANELYVQQPDGSFVLAVNHGAEDPSGRGRIPVFFDFNHDGWPDIYNSNLSTQRDDNLPNINHVFVNQRNGTFVEVVTKATGHFGSQCVAKGDMNHDGWDDIVTCDEKLAPHFFVNNRLGDFIEVFPPAMTGELKDAKLVDMNGDGRDDLVVLTATGRFQIYFNTGRSPFYMTPAVDDQLPYLGVALTVADMNQDGKKDVYVVLDDPDCGTTNIDVAPDVVYWGQPDGTWLRQTLTQSYEGCGHNVDSLDGYKLVLMNGGVGNFGPNYLLNWVK
jgi:hypothetical protein